MIEKLICQKEDRDGRDDVENFAQDEAVEIYIEPEADRSGIRIYRVIFGSCKIVGA